MVHYSENYFVDPFGALHMKIIATVAYIMALPGCGVALCFIWYEVSGRAGPYRTCINQLVSRVYFILSFHCVFISLVDLIRVWYGPLPEYICAPMQVTRHANAMMGFLILTVVSILKAWIVCVRKSVPTMDDNFVVIFVTMTSFMLSLLYSTTLVILPQKPALAHWICNGQYGSKEHELKRTLPIPAIIVVIALTSTMTSAILVYFQRRKLEQLEKLTLIMMTTSFPNRIPRSLESLIGNVTVACLILLTCTGTLVFKVPIDGGMNQFPYAYFVLEHMFICPLIISAFMGCVALYQHGKVLKRSILSLV